MPHSYFFAPVFRARRVILPLVLLLSLAACSPGGTTSESASPASAAPSASVPLPLSFVKVPAPSLEGNLLGERAEREVGIYLPPDYFTSDSDFPVVYYLPGYGSTSMGINMPGDLNTAFAETPGMIVVIVSGVNTFGGSFYVDSPVTGGWDAFISSDLVTYIDANFRTIPAAASRGIAGHSMGGSGALDLAMRHPDVFGSVFAMSPGLFDPEGEQDGPFFANETSVRRMIAWMDEVRDMPAADAISTLRRSPLAVDIGYGMAFAPDDQVPYFRYPYSIVDGELVRDDAVWAEWASGFGGIDAELAEFGENWRSLDGIGIDIGSNDLNLSGCAYLDAALTAAGIDHTYTVFSGGHVEQLRSRILEHMLPFFGEHLART